MDIAGIYDKVVSHAMALGVFERFPTHEPKNAPGSGITWAITFHRFSPAPRVSGLSATALRLEFLIRFYLPMTMEPQDDIDQMLVEAVDNLGASYTGDFDLDGVVFMIDLLGAYGQPFGGQTGYITIAQTMYRVFDITLPVIVDDVWAQAGSNS